MTIAAFKGDRCVEVVVVCRLEHSEGGLYIEDRCMEVVTTLQ